MQFKLGSITKITVYNFVTYSYAEMFPGPNLNMLIGPNGTGKSTIVAAIILGLGGSPKTVGRGHKISDYVKHNCEEAATVIILKADKDEHISIERKFNLREKSVWKLNGTEVTLKEIEKIKKLLKIQVDNLCQFLPQDKVADFAKMNKQQLLQQMQIAVCREDLIEKQQNLIGKKEKYKELSELLAKHNQKLKELNEANVRLEGKVQNLTKRKKYLKQIEHLDRKIAWMHYEALREKMEEIKNDKNIAIKMLEKQQNTSRPIENALSKAKEVIDKLQNKVLTSFRQVKDAETFTSAGIEQFNTLKKNLQNVVEEKNNSLQQIKQHETEISTTSQQINHFEEEKDGFYKKYKSEGEIDKMINLSNQNMRKVLAQINRLQDEKNEIENSKRQVAYEMRLHERDLARLENVREQRMQWLYRVDSDAYNAVKWLRANKHLFVGEVFEPMMLELNVKNQNHAVFVENSIPMRDKLAFTCTVKEDMNLLIRTIRNQQNLNINVIHSGDDGKSANSYTPAIPIQNLKHLGFFAYIKDLVTGPEPILKYLCKNYRFHNIPVGNKVTNSKYEEVPKQISLFFSDVYSFSTTFSKYTGAKSVRQNEIRSDGSLSISIEAERIETIRQMYLNSQKEEEIYTRNQLEIEEKISTLNTQKSSFQNEITALQNSKRILNNIESKIRILRNKLVQLQSNPINAEEVERRTRSKIKDLLKDAILQQLLQVQKAFKKFNDVSIAAELQRLNLDSSRKQVVVLENKLRDVKKALEEAELRYNSVKEAYSKAVGDGKVALRKAKEMSNGAVPTDSEFEEFREAYEHLTDDLEELEAEKDTILSKIDCLNTANDGELNEFEERQRNILLTQDKIRSESSQVDELSLEIERIQSGWLVPLQELVEQINEKFSAAFKRMGCEGEVDIYTGANDNDFAEYGLSIKVKYRHSEPLQELNNIVQSGGERAVATAVFMMSLQELTPVPFRCVDEINQGMDANNERRIFEFLVETTSKADTSQYFLITPKLVPGLKFVPTMRIHNVHNGPFVSSQNEWNRFKGT